MIHAPPPHAAGKRFGLGDLLFMAVLLGAPLLFF